MHIDPTSSNHLDEPDWYTKELQYSGLKFSFKGEAPWDAIN